ncbi:hypothetical protein CEUSTIGMA_g13598.t1 [Chlamydomonas eustigma]|uniref:Phytanoyl-CoA dioxygenase n=1 Tax=Chlamydomonas eustigma TaxID=1157962 RepID=A0A250XSZ7_9CHLO|nr:hypothetical protein CEUSTIGMA_g13598.t1 [Chlamydomonas eustigma]|eukprot:GAX86185.1 hypothetical protein CEUSTIGMA_g13598.t1 [Chlamydomonas eustigma]
MDFISNVNPSQLFSQPSHSAPHIRSTDLQILTSADLDANRKNTGLSEDQEMLKCMETFGYCIHKPDEESVHLIQELESSGQLSARLIKECGASSSAIEPIFQDFKIQGTGIEPDARMKERRALPLSRGGVPLKYGKSSVKTLQKDWLGGCLGISDHDSVLIDVVQNESQRWAQPPHIDYALSSTKELLNVAILALADFSLYIYPRSHLLVRSLAQFLGDEKQFEHTSNMDADKLFASNMGMQYPIRVNLRVGELLIFDGYLVHAGTEGLVGEARPRLHLYLQECHPTVLAKDVEGFTTTYPLNRIHPNIESSLFAAKFARVVIS